MKTTIYICLIATMILVSCEKKIKTKKSMNVGNNLKEAIEEFEYSNRTLKEELQEAFSSTATSLKENDATELPGITQDFENDWNKITDEFNSLQSTFSTVKKRSEKYFQELSQVVESISDPALKAEQERLNQLLDVKWQNTSAVAENKIKEIEKVLSEGFDFHKVLLASSLRNKLEANINDLNSIIERADSLLNELQQFASQTKHLLSNE